MFLQATARGYLLRRRIRQARQAFERVFHELEPDSGHFVHWRSEHICLPCLSSVREQQIERVAVAESPTAGRHEHCDRREQAPQTSDSLRVEENGPCQTYADSSPKDPNSQEAEVNPDRDAAEHPETQLSPVRDKRPQPCPCRSSSPPPERNVGTPDCRSDHGGSIRRDTSTPARSTADTRADAIFREQRQGAESSLDSRWSTFCADDSLIDHGKTLT